jgi:soluble P-type ATPase
MRFGIPVKGISGEFQNLRARLFPSIRCYNYPMIELSVPGRGDLYLEHLVMDVNGTLAIDGMLLEGVAKRIGSLRDRLEIHLLTADTHGRQASIDHLLNLSAVRILPGQEAEQKAGFVQRLGAHTVAAIGQGANDARMLKTAALGICILSTEGLAVETLLSADLFLPDILSALDLFEKPLRLIASLRK